MIFRKNTGLIFAGLCAGAVNGLFGAGGGMLLVPMLTTFTDLAEQEIFPCSVAVILPLCVVSLLFADSLPMMKAFPFMAGSASEGDL